MMKVKDIKSLVERQPFRPFYVRLSNGPNKLSPIPAMSARRNLPARPLWHAAFNCSFRDMKSETAACPMDSARGSLARKKPDLRCTQAGARWFEGHLQPWLGWFP